MSAEKEVIHDMTLDAAVKITFSSPEERERKIRAIEQGIIDFCKEVGGPNPQAEIILRVSDAPSKRRKPNKLH